MYHDIRLETPHCACTTRRRIDGNDFEGQTEFRFTTVSPFSAPVLRKDCATEWTGWTSCTEKCTQVRIRQVTQEPEGDGALCPDDMTEIRQCYADACSLRGTYAFQADVLFLQKQPIKASCIFFILFMRSPNVNTCILNPNSCVQSHGRG
jgi:hypothetical protein